MSTIKVIMLNGLRETFVKRRRFSHETLCSVAKDRPGRQPRIPSQARARVSGI
jgi:hypothetical protein